MGQLIIIVARYGLLGVFMSILIENLGIPFPTEAAFFVALSYVAHHRYSFWQMYWFIVASHMISATLAYSLGRWLESEFMQRYSRSRKFMETEQAIHGWYKKYGSITVLATRLIGYVRPWSSLVAGVAEFSFLPFFLWTFVGTLIFVYPTMRVSALIVNLWHRSPATHVFVSLSVLISLAIALFLFNYRPKAKSKS